MRIFQVKKEWMFAKLREGGSLQFDVVYRILSQINTNTFTSIIINPNLRNIKHKYKNIKNCQIKTLI